MTWLCRKNPSCVEFALEKKKLKGDLLHDVLRDGLERKFAYVRGTACSLAPDSQTFPRELPATRACCAPGWFKIKFKRFKFDTRVTPKKIGNLDLDLDLSLFFIKWLN